jgi:TolB protein
MRCISTIALLAGLFVGCLAEAAGAAFPGRNGRIAYTLEYGDDLVEDLIYSINPDGSERKRFKHVGGIDVAFSPHGRLLAYAHPYGSGLWVTRADGRGRDRRLTRGNDFDPAWAPGGRRIVFSRYPVNDGDPKLRIYHEGTTRPLTDGAEPAWSVKGWIAFQNDGGIYTSRPDGTRLRQVVEAGSSPDWSPDGRRIVFNTASGYVATVRADGSGLRRLRRGSEPAFSPDGRKIVYLGDPLTTMSANGRRPRRVPHSSVGLYEDEDLLGPDWQPLAPFR